VERDNLLAENTRKRNPSTEGTVLGKLAVLGDACYELLRERQLNSFQIHSPPSLKTQHILRFITPRRRPFLNLFLHCISFVREASIAVFAIALNLFFTTNKQKKTRFSLKLFLPTVLKIDFITHTVQNIFKPAVIRMKQSIGKQFHYRLKGQELDIMYCTWKALRMVWSDRSRFKQGPPGIYYITHVIFPLI
jgi:hypothetical protein